jgi:hypothetical protein
MIQLASVGLALASLFAHHHDPPPLDPPPTQTALASWYDDYYGSTASGVRYQYGYASLLFGSQWGHRVEFAYAGRTVVGQLDDHGPYVSGRLFDLSARLRGALNCPDLCYLRWRSLP